MKYTVAFGIIIVFHVVANIFAAVSGKTVTEVLVALTVGGLALLAADFYMTKEGR